MQKSSCLSCKTYFEEGQVLPLQGLCIELKNYPFPIKETKHKWNLLKTICSLLNSKGGTIFIGAQDKTGEVKGNLIQRKELDDFKIFIQQLTERIQPQVDLCNHEEIMVQFVPILKATQFGGKYLIKIVVKQGQLHQFYCFTQKIQLSSQDKKIDEYQIVYGYRRLNGGTTKQYKGYELIKQVAAKAEKPPAASNIFHEGCNPQPPNLTIQVMKIGFKNIDNQTRNLLQQWFVAYLKQLEIDPLISYDSESDILVIDFDTKQDFKKTFEFVDKNIKELNEALQNCQFVKRDTFLDCKLYENIKPRIKNKPKKKFAKKEGNENQSEMMTEVKQQKRQKTEQGENRNENRNENRKSEDRKSEDRKSEDRKSEDRKSSTDLMREEMIPVKKKNKNKLCYTFTHINPKKKEQFNQFIRNLAPNQITFLNYENTTEVFFENQEDFQTFNVLARECNEEISNEFGFGGRINHGINQGELRIQNYNNKTFKELKNYLTNLIGNDLKSIESRKKGNKYSMILKFTSKRATCEWLDKLLIDKKLKSFCIPGSEKGQCAKMKIYLTCKNTIEDQE